MGAEGIEPPSSGLEPDILPVNYAPFFISNKKAILSFTVQYIYKFLALIFNMPKKSVEKTSSASKSIKTSKKSMEIEETLVKNLVELQKIHAGLAEKFDSLSKQISHILALFETTARTFAKNAPLGEYEKDKDFLEKIDRLLEQNKTLAKGLMLMEERLRERMYGPRPQPPAMQDESSSSMQPSISSRNRQLPHF